MLRYRVPVARAGAPQVTLFVVTWSYTSDQRPVSDAKARDAYGTDPAPMMAVGQKLGVRPIAGPRNSSEQWSFTVVEAPQVEAVREFLVQTGPGE